MLEGTQALIAASELTEIGFFELVGVRGLVGDDGERVVMGPGRVGDDEIEVDDATHQLGVYWTDEGDRVLVRLLASLTTAVGELRAGVQGEYELKDMNRSDIPVEVEEYFVNRVAIMALLPYIRTAISDLSGRLFGTTLTMAVVRPGEISFTRGPAEEWRA